jgi:hypothetical protein
LRPPATQPRHRTSLRRSLSISVWNPSPGIGLGRPVQRVLQGTHLIPGNDNAFPVGGTSQTGTHRAPSATSARIDEVVALPSPAVVSSARLNRYYDHLRLPSGWLPLPGSSPVIGHRAPPRPCATGWAGEGLSSSRRHYLSVPQPLTPGSPSAPAPPGLQRLPWPSPFTAGLGTPSTPPTGRVISRRGRLHFTLRTAQLHAPKIGALDAGLRPRPFPDETASLLPGHLAATRTGLTPASNDELTKRKINHLHDQPSFPLDAPVTDNLHRSGSRGDFHPPAPTDPYVNLSVHTALVILVVRRAGPKRPISSVRTSGDTSR